MKSFFHYYAMWGSDTKTMGMRREILSATSKDVKALEPIVTRSKKAKIPQGVDAEYINTVAVEALKIARGDA